MGILGIFGDIPYSLCFTGLNQYTVKSTAKDLTTFRSPKSFQHKACFVLQYYSSYVNSRLFVFIRDTTVNNSAPLPFWSKQVVNKAKWQKTKILLDHKSGFNQVSHVFLKFHFNSTYRMYKRNWTNFKSLNAINSCETH